MSKFHSKWEAEILEESVVASGTWNYQNEVPCSVKLVKQLWNYTSTDLAELDAVLSIPFCDYIDFCISDEGVLYLWVFAGPNGETTSPTFSTYFLARDHINTYGYTYDVSW